MADKTTKDHGEIRRWAEERGGKPSHVKDTGSTEDIGILRIDFPGYSGQSSLESITWEAWFDKFDERNLALLYQDETAEGQPSSFNKIVSSETAQEAETRPSGGTRATRGAVRPKRAPKKKATKKAAAKKGARRSASTKKKATKKKATKRPIKRHAPRRSSRSKSAGAKQSASRSARSGSSAFRSSRKRSAAKKSPTKKRR